MLSKPGRGHDDILAACRAAMIDLWDVGGGQSARAKPRRRRRCRSLSIQMARIYRPGLRVVRCRISLSPDCFMRARRVPAQQGPAKDRPALAGETDCLLNTRPRPARLAAARCPICITQFTARHKHGSETKPGKYYQQTPRGAPAAAGDTCSAGAVCKAFNERLERGDCGR